MQEQALSSFTSPQQSLALALWPEPWGCISGNLGPQSPGWEANCSATNQKSSKSAGDVASREPPRQFSSLWLQPPAMFPVATGTRGSSQDLLTAGPAPPGGWPCVCQGCGLEGSRWPWGPAEAKGYQYGLFRGHQDQGIFKPGFSVFPTPGLLPQVGAWLEESETQRVGVHFHFQQLPTPARAASSELELSWALPAVSGPF